MSWFRFLRRKRWDDERARELEAYLENETLDNIARGMPPEDARYAAQRKLGNTVLIREEIYDMNSIAFLETWQRDLRQAFRGLWKNPGFTIAVLVVLALGIGVNTAIFNVVNAVLLRPLPFEDSASIVSLFHVPPQAQFPGITRFVLSPANYLDWKASSTSFESMAAYATRQLTLTGGDQPEALLAAVVAPEFFTVTRVSPERGRAFSADSDRPGHPKEAVISHSFWLTHMASNPNVLGQTLVLNRETYTIVGVMPARIELKAWSATNAQLWVPLVWDDADRAVRGNHNYLVVARLKSGVTIARAGAELDAISKRLAVAYPKDDAGWGSTIMPLSEMIVGDVRERLWVLLGAVGFVLLIASANVANLTLARTLGRRKEMAVRAALGATRGQVLQFVLAESLLLSVAGGAIGLALASLGMPAVRAMLAGQLPRASEISLDPRVLIFTFAISLFAGVAAGIVPALRAGRVNLNDTLKQGGRGETRATGARTRGLLVVSEVALSFVLLVGAGLLIRSFWALRAANPGFDPRNVATMSMFIPPAKYATPAQQSAFFDETLRRTRALPGIEAAAFVDNPPLTGGSMQPVTIEGQPIVAMSEQPEVATRRASPGYLQTMRLPLRLGRDFRDDDAYVVLVSESMARQFWPNENPLGRHMRFTFHPENLWEVIGVVGDVKTGDLAESPRSTVYQCTNKLAGPFATLVARTSGDPNGFVKSIVDVIHQVDRDEPAQNIQSMEELVDTTIAPERLSALLLGVFAALAVALAGVGIYGVLAYAVRSRTREIGIRAALGADMGAIVRLVLIEGLKPALVGIAAGAAGALALARLMTGLVYGVSTSDPATLAAVAVLFFTVSTMASILPAYRASKVDPLRTLREE